MHKGIVLRETQRNAFLAMAAQEGLICENGETDGVFGEMTKQIPSLQLAQQIFEMLIVSGAVYVDPFVYKCMDGELIEKEIIMPYEKCKNNFDGYFIFDIVTVQQMMREQGWNLQYYTADKIIKMYDEWKYKAKMLVNYEKKYNINYESVWLSNLLKITKDKEFDEIYYLELRSSVLENPVFKILVEYTKLVGIAYHNNLLSPVSGKVINSDFMKAPKVMSEENEAINILRYTSRKLNRVYTASSLRENIKLIRTSEARAYREKINEWIVAFSEQNYNTMQIVEEDILKAQKAIKFKNIVEHIGKICAICGVSSMIFKEIYPSIDIIGEITTLAGLPLAFYNPQKKYLWSSFGIFDK